jgi:hypothetical protein
MKKQFVFLMIVFVFALPVFAMYEASAEFENSVPAQNDPENISEKTPLKKHQFPDNYFGVALGFGGMRFFDRGILTGALGVSYDFYPNDRVSINTGFLLHTELYQEKNLLTANEAMVSPLCFTIPFGVHFNMPKVEWLYAGVNLAINIPIMDLNSGDKNAFSQKDVFISLPIDLGFDFIKPGRGGPRVFFRITPTFHKDGIAVPIGLVWQIYNWKVFAKKVDIKVPRRSYPPKIIIIQ